MAALSAQMWARVQRHLAAIQPQSRDILDDLRTPLDYALLAPLGRVAGQR